MCERHFDQSQILTYWEHTINGQVHQIQREKPKIKADAIPYLHLPGTADVPRVAATEPSPKRAQKEPKKRKQNLSNLNQKVKIEMAFQLIFDEKEIHFGFLVHK